MYIITIRTLSRSEMTAQSCYACVSQGGGGRPVEGAGLDAWVLMLIGEA